MKITRRSVLRSTGGTLAFSSATGVANANSLKMKRVPRFLGRDGVKEWMKVPESWYNHLQTAKKIKSDFSKSYGVKKGVMWSGLVADPSKEFGRKPGFQIKVEVDDHQFSGSIPSEIIGINVQKTSPRKRGPAATDCCSANQCYVNDCYWPDLPGGVPITDVNESNEDDGGTGTICCWVEKDNEYRVLTAAHLEDPCNGNVDTSDKFEQRFRELGTVYDWDTSADWILIDNDSGNHNPTDKIHDGENVHTVNGVVSETAIADLVNDDSTCGDDEDKVYQVGWTTGRTSGCVTAIHSSVEVGEGWSSVCWSFDGEGVEFSNKNAEGDSGGPVFVDNGDWVYIVSLNNNWIYDNGTMCGGRTIGEYGEGTAAYYLRNNFGMTFDTNISNGISCSDVTDCRSEC